MEWLKREAANMSLVEVQDKIKEAAANVTSISSMVEKLISASKAGKMTSEERNKVTEYKKKARQTINELNKLDSPLRKIEDSVTKALGDLGDLDEGLSELGKKLNDIQ